ncbi:S-adenosyl-L-methionine-dependent methyltransferase [Xylariaceae sp. FL0594]|nr:S-adenosyl-L-methionine-dependent methyltransferase [Xylariaceae sp. FL0594]
MPPLTKAQKKQAQGAVDSFNRTYAAIYGEERWNESLYPALAGPTRYAALVNRYVPGNNNNGLENVLTPEQRRRVERIVFPALSTHSSSSSSSTTTTAGGLLEAYQWTDEGEENEIFPPPQPDPNPTSGGLMTHWNLDAASLLAVHVLGPRPGDKVLDLCAAPGGKSIAIAQLLLIPESLESGGSLGGGCLHSNEVNNGRNRRLAANLRAYLPAPLFAFNKELRATATTTTTTGGVIGEEVKVLKIDGTEQSVINLQKALPLAFGSAGAGGYDKVLLDAPCSSERHVIHAHVKNHPSDDEMASWRSSHSKKLAKTQTALLVNALRVVKNGGRILYATCSLSPEENDGVVEKAREVLLKERKKVGIKWGFEVVDLAGTAAGGTADGNGLEDWAEKTKYGWLVLPDHPSGGRWGPLFFALLEKVAV